MANDEYTRTGEPAPRTAGDIATLNTLIGTLIDSIEGYTKSAAEKKRSQDRFAILEKSRAAIPPAATNARNARKDLDPLIEALRKRYAETMEALEANVEAQQARAAK